MGQIDSSDVKAFLTDEVYAIIKEHQTMANVAGAIIDENRSHQAAATDLSEQVEQSSTFNGVQQALLDMVDWRAVVERIDADRYPR